ncbi:hypothetical protein ACNQFZ_20200 [Schinkia sp. CFF1]
MDSEKEYRTYQINVKKGHKLYPYFDDLCLKSNNLYNTTNFFIRQVYTALHQERQLQPLQKEVMDILHENIHKMNAAQHKAYLKRMEKENQKLEHKSKKVREVTFEIQTREKPFLGYSFLDCLFKTMKQKDYYSWDINAAAMKQEVY